ncbi:THO complex subunit 6 homolog [Daphnia pulicaria]|uniref:THO complex subunit 6 homolog n=1 Tax=Daphnia pulicaria TaxID=35523 RepID=UPI001EEA61BF|nr:THO complex subunit 6 homolog [Daphnia pulicaria]
MPNIKSFYVTVLSQALSPCEEFLAAGTNFGNVNIFNIKSLYAEDEQQGPRESLTLPQKCFSVSTKPLQAITSLNDNLLVGGKNCIEAFSWNQLVLPQNSDEKVKPCWKVDLRLPTDFGTKETVDCMINGENSTFVACGDNNIHHVDLEYGKVKQTFSGHTDFIHSMSLVGNQLSSASEDGTVCIWDTRKSKPNHVITPHLESKLNRPHLGKWVGAVAMNEDWLVCGGGPHLGLYHLRSLTMSRVLLEEDVHGVNNVMFHEDNIIVGVDGPFVYQCLFSGDITVKMPTSPLRVYNICLQKKDANKLLFVGGSGGDIDICTSSKLQDQVIRCLS